MLSVIIPTLNAARHLPDCLAALRLYPDAIEIIVVDGGSSDDTTQIAARCGARLLTAEAGRARQMIAGAGRAKGDWLLFLHGDTVLDPAWPAAAAGHMAAQMTAEIVHPAAGGRAGYFRFALDDKGWRPALWRRGVRLRNALLALPYGDQGLLIKAALYRQVGGFNPLPFLEDVDLVRRLGRRRLRPLGASAVTSAERYRRDGYWRRGIRNCFIVLFFLAGLPAARLARWYA